VSLPSAGSPSQWAIGGGVNVKKSDLEDDLSAVTMQADSYGRFATDDARLVTEARRKGAKSTSRRTRKPIEESSETVSLEGRVRPGLTASVRLLAPPQPDRYRAFELARMHVSALFYVITFNAESGLGGFWRGEFYAVNAALRADWGNSVQRAFATAVLPWEPRSLRDSSLTALSLQSSAGTPKRSAGPGRWSGTRTTAAAAALPVPSVTT
jgi:hypothetical protein